LPAWRRGHRLEAGGRHLPIQAVPGLCSGSAARIGTDDLEAGAPSFGLNVCIATLQEYSNWGPFSGPRNA
jgi:hypothetical protein